MPVSGNPNVKITFTGLLVFSFDPDECQIGVLKAPVHKLRIESGKKTSLTPTPTMSSIGTDAEISAGPIRIEVTKPQIKGMIMYFDSEFKGAKADNRNDFRWLIDMKKVHGKPLPIKNGSLSPFIYLKNGFFYTDEIKIVSLIPPGATTGVEQNMANTIGVNIYFDDPTSELVLSYGTDGAKKLTLKNEPDTTHVVMFSNDCPPVPIPPAVLAGHPAEVEADFKFYYDVFDVPADKRFVMKFKVPGGGDTLGHPCGPVKTG